MEPPQGQENHQQPNARTLQFAKHFAQGDAVQAPKREACQCRGEFDLRSQKDKVYVLHLPLAICAVSPWASWNLGFFTCKAETGTLTTQGLEQIGENQVTRARRVPGAEKASGRNYD